MRTSDITTRSPHLLVAVTFIALIAVGCSSDGDDVVRSDERWDARGSLLAWDGDVWIVDDQPLIVPASLGVDDQRVLGATVDASGTVDSSGRRLTETIDISGGDWPDSSLPAESIEGTIEQVDDSAGVWTVGGHQVVVPTGVRVHGADVGAFSPGDSVTIAGHRLDDDRIIALDISMLDTSDSDNDTGSDSQSEAPFDPAVFSTPVPDDDSTDARADDDDPDDKPENRRKKDKEKDRE